MAKKQKKARNLGAVDKLGRSPEGMGKQSYTLTVGGVEEEITCNVDEFGIANCTPNCPQRAKGQYGISRMNQPCPLVGESAKATTGWPCPIWVRWQMGQLNKRK